VRSAEFQAKDWSAARAPLRSVGLTRYCDFNLANLVAADPAKLTFEVRVLPVHLTPAPILSAAADLERLLAGC
jgi:hypothetical protein